MAEAEEIVAEEGSLEAGEVAAESEAEAAAVEAVEASEETPSEPEESGPAGSVRTVDPPLNPNLPELRPGDDVSVHVLIKEGDRERVQEFRGTVIRMRKGGVNASFTVRRLAAHGIGVERTFLLRSPLIDKIEIQRRAHVRRAKLYYLRDRTGKRARLKEKRQS